MVQMRPSEDALIKGTVSALFFALVVGWRIGLTIFIIFAFIAFAMRKLGPRAGMERGD